MTNHISAPQNQGIQSDANSAEHTRARAFPDMSETEIQNFLEERYGPGFAQWFVDQLDRKCA